MADNKKIQAVNFFSYAFWLLTFCYLVFLWATNSPMLWHGVIYGVTFSVVIALILIAFKIKEKKEEQISNVKTIKKNLKFSDLDSDGFENLLIRLFGAMSYIVECIDEKNEKGLILYKNRTKSFVVFCHNALDDLTIIKSISLGIKQNNCYKGILVCLPNVSKNIFKSAEDNNIDVVDKKYLQELLLSYLNEKWQ